MRRKDREIINKEQIWRIMQRCGVCRVAFHDAEYPYIVPLNFGIGKGEPLTLYFHCAAQGKKLDLMQRDRRVSFEMDCAHQLVTGDLACDTTMEYESVCGNGPVGNLRWAGEGAGPCPRDGALLWGEAL